jgi:serine O-acetyltransferase
VNHLLGEQVLHGFCFTCAEKEDVYCEECERKAQEITAGFLSNLPQIRYLLSSDVEAAYEGDPAAKSRGETIFCYPSIRALTSYRLAHTLHTLGAQLIPRIMTEMAHSDTGIDIHPSARIGERLFIDHGTGVVIGETCIIGRNVRIYQGVTLGAKSFPLDEQGKPVKGIPRHPIVEDNVIIYSGATILGRITIGRDSVIGGNVWLTHDVAPGSRIMHNEA